MTGRIKGKKNPRLAIAALAAALAAATIACGTDYFEIPIETPIQPKLDVSPFQRVLVAGFVAGGTEDVDANQETVRLLRSQLRTKSQLKVIDADIMPLFDIAQEQAKAASAPAEEPVIARENVPTPGANGSTVGDHAAGLVLLRFAISNATANMINENSASVAMAVGRGKLVSAPGYRRPRKASTP